jgi:CHAD domain-containing protein
VAFKKFRYSIELLDAVFPWVTRRLRKEMNHYQTALGELQDLEVLSAGLRTFARRRRPVRPASLASFLPVYGALDRRREELLAEFRRSVDAIDRFWGAAGDRE